MNYDRFKIIFNENIFEKSKKDLIEKIARFPYRYIGIFRPTKPRAKILQNLLQSHEIRFGDAFEILIEEYLKEKGYEILNKKFVDANNEILKVDLCFRAGHKTYFAEQKIRDDHDSTKKRGQIANFKRKLDLIITQYGKKDLIGFLYFIDPELTKNKNFYREELSKMADDYGVTLHLFYGNELFNYLNINKSWNEILKYLKKWKQEIPEFPEINFDVNAPQSFNEIKEVSPSIFRRLLTHDEIFSEILLTLFPERKTLKLLWDYFTSKSTQSRIYATLSAILKTKL